VTETDKDKKKGGGKEPGMETLMQ